MRRSPEARGTGPVIGYVGNLPDLTDMVDPEVRCLQMDAARLSGNDCAVGPISAGLSRRWFAWAMYHVADRYDRLLADRKRDLLGCVNGTVVEIGPGTGTNFRL